MHRTTGNPPGCNRKPPIQKIEGGERGGSGSTFGLKSWEGVGNYGGAPQDGMPSDV
jgi:hypothetical protein